MSLSIELGGQQGQISPGFVQGFVTAARLIR